MVRHLHTDRDQIDVRMLCQPGGISECQGNAEMPGCRIGGVLARRADGSDVDVRQRLKRRNMRDRGETAPRARPDDAYAQLAARRHDVSPTFRLYWMLLDSGPSLHPRSRGPSLTQHAILHDGEELHGGLAGRRSSGSVADRITHVCSGVRLRWCRVREMTNPNRTCPPSDFLATRRSNLGPRLHQRPATGAPRSASLAWRHALHRTCTREAGTRHRARRRQVVAQPVCPAEQIRQLGMAFKAANSKNDADGCSECASR
jgi:hypothetical protein